MNLSRTKLIIGIVTGATPCIGSGAPAGAPLWLDRNLHFVIMETLTSLSVPRSRATAVSVYDTMSV